jgi:cytoskeletal protein CcmA (bactofilin family)
MFNKKQPDEVFTNVVSTVAANGNGKTAFPYAANGLPARALIDAGLNIKGDLQTDGEVQVDGRVDGNISCAQLIVGEVGTVVGDVKANEVVVRGKVDGIIRASRVILQASARVAGDIFHDRLAIEEGADFVGGSKKQNEEQAKPVAKPKQVATEVNLKAVGEPA